MVTKLDLKAELKKKLEPNNAEIFKFETPGDRIIFRVGVRRSIVKDGHPSELVEIDVLVGEKTDPQTKKVVAVKPGKRVLFLQTDSVRIFDREKPQPGDLWHLQLAAIRADLRGMKQFAYEILEKVPRKEVQTSTPDINDDIADFKAP
jgi:hypothetical protein